MPEQTTDSTDKSFADFLGQLVEGKAEGLDDDMKHYGSQLTALRDKHKDLVQSISQTEQKIMQSKSQAIKLEGALEAVASVIRRLWEHRQAAEGEVLKKTARVFDAARDATATEKP